MNPLKPSGGPIRAPPPTSHTSSAPAYPETKLCTIAITQTGRGAGEIRQEERKKTRKEETRGKKKHGSKWSWLAAAEQRSPWAVGGPNTPLCTGVCVHIGACAHTPTTRRQIPTGWRHQEKSNWCRNNIPRTKEPRHSDMKKQHRIRTHTYFEEKNVIISGLHGAWGFPRTG